MSRSTVVELMRRAIVVLDYDDALHISRRMADHDVDVVAVTDVRGIFVGVVTRNDLIVQVLAEGRESVQTLADDVRTDRRTPMSLDVGDSVSAALTLMGNSQVRDLPVLEDGRVVGTVTVSDILAASQESIVAELVGADRRRNPG